MVCSMQKNMPGKEGDLRGLGYTWRPYLHLLDIMFSDLAFWMAGQALFVRR